MQLHKILHHLLNQRKYINHNIIFLIFIGCPINDLYGKIID